MILQIPKNVVAKYPFAEIPMGSFVAVNNVWGDQGGAFLNQSVRTTEDGRTVRLRWDIKPEAHDAVMGFPNISCGKHPWSPESTTKELPVRLGDVKSLPVTLDYKLGRKGKCNAVLDCWITSGLPHGQSDIIMEVIVWLEAHGDMVPYGHAKPFLSSSRPIPESSIWSGHATFANDSVPVVTYIPINPINSTLRFLCGGLHAFLMHAIMTHGLSPEECYLSAIELGAECVAGKSWMDVNRFDVEVVI